MPIYQEVHPSVGAAQGFHWLLRFIRGETIANMAKGDHRAQSTVSKYMRRAANLMVDSAQELVMRELFPLAAELMKESLKSQIEKAKKGEPVDLAMAERIMKAMYVFDSPQLKDAVQALEEGTEIETLAGFMVQRTNAQLKQPNPLPMIEGEKVTDGNQNNPNSDT